MNEYNVSGGYNTCNFTELEIKGMLAEIEFSKGLKSGN